MRLLFMIKKKGTTYRRQVVSLANLYLADKGLYQKCTKWEDNG